MMIVVYEKSNESFVPAAKTQLQTKKVMVPIQKRVCPWEQKGFRNKREFMLDEKREFIISSGKIVREK